MISFDDVYRGYLFMLSIDDIHGRGPPVQKIRTQGEHETIHRVKYAESHGPHGKVTALKKR